MKLETLVNLLLKSPEAPVHDAHTMDSKRVVASQEHGQYHEMVLPAEERNIKTYIVGLAAA